MATLVLKLTDAGLAAVQAASGSDPTVIDGLGLTATPFDYAPTLTALPGEFKRVEVASGIASAANVTHLTAYDTSADVWTATGFGLFLDDGTLFAVHTGAEPVMSKVSLAFALLAFDIAFEADFASNIAYGNAVFAYPLATEDISGVAEIATQGEVDAGDDDRRFVTPRKLRDRLASILQAIATEVQTRASNVADLWTALGNETGSREAADTNLGTAINNEATARGNADGALGGRIDGEVAARADADNALSGAIGAEATARVDADNALGGRIDSEAQSRTNADNALGGRIDAEAQSRSNADAALGGRIDGEAAARSNADNGLQEQINARLVASAYTADDVRDKLRTVDGADSGIDADLLDGYQGADYDRVIQRNFVANGGYEVFASGKKVTWGTFSMLENSTVTFVLPVGHTSWVNPVLGVSSVAGNTDIQDNTGIAGINVDANGAPTGIRIWNADDRTVTVWIRTLGV
ncbi:hypothetical protein [Novosphingobium resinovorum]|uniref:hypothetical protein n=1 Tax=Novosphingobium resinovorum TaxID=158500 RepID=UPI002ED5CB59|nr:hypothetical protein [Novosphingobium resinovorum]